MGKVDSARKVVTIETKLGEDLLEIDQKPVVIIPEGHPAYGIFDNKYAELFEKYPGYLVRQLEELYGICNRTVKNP